MAIQLREVENLASCRGGQVAGAPKLQEGFGPPGNDRPSAMETPLR